MDSPEGKVQAGEQRAAESRTTTNTPHSAGKFKNHQGRLFFGRAGGACNLQDDLRCLTKAEDNSNVQIKPKLATVDHSLAGEKSEST